MARRIEISSRQNPWIRRIARALQKHRDEVVLEGPRFVRDAVAKGNAPIAIAVRRGADAPCENDAPLLEVEDAVFRELVDAVTSQGVLGLFPRPDVSWDSVDPSRGPIVVLDAIQDPGNVGTIVRLSAAFDAAAVLCTEGCADPWGPKALRASVGAMLEVPVLRLSATEIAGRLSGIGVEKFVADAGGELTHPREFPCAVVFGNEGAGVSPIFREGARRIAIDTSGRVESLNVASAAAILLSRIWETRRTLASASLTS